MPVRYEIPGAPYPARGYMSSLNGRLIEVTAREAFAQESLDAVKAERLALEAELAHLESKRTGVAA